MSQPNLALYFYEACPYCQIVLEAVDDLGIKVDYCNTREDKNHYNKLVQDTGRGTVPCLYIDGQPMHESADIVRWLKANAAKLTKNG